MGSIMPRIIDPLLAAGLKTGNYDVSFECSRKHLVRIDTYIPFKFKISGTELSATTKGASKVTSQVSNPKNLFILKRKITVGGVVYEVSTSNYFIKSMERTTRPDADEEIELTYNCSLFPIQKVSFLADGTYKEAIESFCIAIGRTYTLRNPTADYWQYQFLPNGKYYTTNSAESFITYLRSKYFIFACDNGNDNILFYCALDQDGTDHTITPTQLTRQKIIFNSERYLMARDENASIRYAGNNTNQIHNMGYLKSTDNFPTVFYQRELFRLEKEPVNLNYMDGDHSTEDETLGFNFRPMVITEVFDTKISPAWHINIEQLEYFNSTEGGSLPSTIERVAAYTPLVSTGFDGNLTPAVNNLQALAQAVDDMAIGSGVPEAPADNVYYGRRNTAWVNLKTYFDSIYQAIGSYITDATSDSVYYVRRNAAWTNAKTYFDTLYAALSHSHAGADITSGTVGTARLGSGTADGTTYLRGDQTWATPAGGGGGGRTVNMSFSEVTTLQTGTTTIPPDNTKPQSNEGNQYLTVTHTPVASGNKLRVKVKLCISNTANQFMGAALFKDSDTDCLRSDLLWQTTNELKTMGLNYEMTTTSTAAIAFKVRAGGHTAGTTNLNGVAGTTYHNGTLASWIEVTEIEPI
jgi:hypothetical protein